MSLNRENNRFDILRLAAAWFVLFNHSYPLGGRKDVDWFTATIAVDTLGGLGVGIFFILSGYLVTVSVERSSSIVDFAKRRALRIYPALIAICLLSALVLGPLLTTLTSAEYWRHDMTWDYLKTARAFALKYPLPGVFTDNPTPNAVNGSLWSLPYEIACYVVLALIGFLPGSLRYKALAALAILVTLFCLRPAVPPASPFERFMVLDYYHTKLGVLFALGAVFASWRDRIQPRLWPALLALSSVFWLPYGNLLMVLYLFGLASLTLWLALNAMWLPKIPARIGDWSYGAYLYAFPIQQTLAHFKLHEISFAGYVVACTVVTFGLAGLSWHYIEKPALRWK